MSPYLLLLPALLVIVLLHMNTKWKLSLLVILCSMGTPTEAHILLLVLAVIVGDHIGCMHIFSCFQTFVILLLWTFSPPHFHLLFLMLGGGVILEWTLSCDRVRLYYLTLCFPQFGDEIGSTTVYHTIFCHLACKVAVWANVISLPIFNCTYYFLFFSPHEQSKLYSKSTNCFLFPCYRFEKKGYRPVILDVVLLCLMFPYSHHERTKYSSYSMECVFLGHRTAIGAIMLWSFSYYFFY